MGDSPLSVIPNPLPSIPNTVKEKIYDDAIHKTMQELGKLSALPLQIFNKCLSPFEKWATDSGQKNTAKLQQKVAENLADIPKENIIEPSPHLAVPVIIANSYNENEDLRDLYAKLLAKSMDKKTQSQVHPSFVEIIKQLSPEEALLLKTNPILQESLPICSIRYQKKSVYENYDTFILHPQNIIKNSQPGIDILKYYFLTPMPISPEFLSMIIENLERLNLIASPVGTYLSDIHAYEKFYCDSFNQNLPLESYGKDTSIYELAHLIGMISPTGFGKTFYKICIE